MESTVQISTNTTSRAGKPALTRILTEAELHKRMKAIVQMPMNDYRMQKQFELKMCAIRAGWLTFSASLLFMEYESMKEGFDLRSFIVHQSGIDLDRPFTFLHDTRHKVYHWYQDPSEGVN